MGKILNLYRKNIGPAITKALIGSLFTFAIGICVYLIVSFPNEKKELMKHYDEYQLNYKNENKTNNQLLDRIQVNVEVLKNAKDRKYLFKVISDEFPNKNLDADSVSFYKKVFSSYLRENLSDQSKVNAIIDDQNNKVDIKLQSYLQAEHDVIDRLYSRLSNRLGLTEEDKKVKEKLEKTFVEFDDYSSIIYERIEDEINSSDNKQKSERILNDFKNYEQKYLFLLCIIILILLLSSALVYIGIKLGHFKS